MSTDRFYLTKRNNGFYYVGIRITDTCIKWKSTKCRKKPDAIEFMKTFSFASTEHINDKIQTTLSALLNIYIEKQKHELRTRSLENNVRSISAFIQMFGDRLPSLYTISEVEDFKNSFLNRGCTKATANLNYRGCKTVFNYAVKHGFLDKNVFGKSNQFKLDQKRPSFISSEDFPKLLSAVREPILKNIFLFAALSGLRLSEIVNLKWSNIDMTKNLIIIENSESFTTKSGRIRTVPMHSEVVKMFQIFQMKRRAGFEYVFSKSNGYKFAGGFISHRFKKYVRLAGLNDELHFHSLRHTCASLLVSSGVSVYTVQSILGHANVSTTMIYSHLSPSSLQESINKIQL